MFRKMLKNCFAAKRQNVSLDEETSLDFGISGVLETWINCQMCWTEGERIITEVSFFRVVFAGLFCNLFLLASLKPNHNIKLVQPQQV